MTIIVMVIRVYLIEGQMFLIMMRISRICFRGPNVGFTLTVTLIESDYVGASNSLDLKHYYVSLL